MIIGTAGHIDHGKTSLVRALTGVDTDRLKEEKARGISIELGFAYLPTPSGEIIGFVDAPGHERFIHTMLAGASGVDFVVLVVAADDGVMPQTREHLAIVDLLGLRRGAVALTKIDSVAPERVGQVRADIEDLLSSSGLAGAEVAPVSVVTGEGVDEFRARLFAASAETQARATDGAFRFAVDRSFTLSGTGTVVTGVVHSGEVAIGDPVIISPTGLSARVRSIHAQNRAAERGRAGERCALNLAGVGISKDAAARGDFVLAPDLHAPTGRIDVSVRLLRSETKSLAQWTPVRLHHAACDVAARVVPLGDGPVRPGQEALIQLVLEKPIAAAVGDRFVLRDTTAQRTIGGGAILDLRPPSRKRRTPARLGVLRASAVEDRAGALAAMLDLPPFFVDLGSFARDRALRNAQIETIATAQDVVRISGAGVTIGMSRAILAGAIERLLQHLAAFHAAKPDLPGLGFERLRLSFEPRLPAPLFRAFLQAPGLVAKVALDGASVRLSSHAPGLTASDEAIWRRIAPLLSDRERFRPPRVRDIAELLGRPEADVRRLSKLLARMGRLDEVTLDHFFLRTTTAEMADIAAQLAQAAPAGEFTAAQFRDRLDNGRKVAIQILEFFDRHGVTLRRGDLRRINRQKIDIFGTAPAS